MTEKRPVFFEKRPIFLLVLVVLSGINMVISAIGSLSAALGAKPDKFMIKNAKLDFANMREQLQKANAEDFIYIVDQMEGITMNMFRHFQFYNSVQMLILAMGLTGIVLMYQRKKLGFHFYIIYSIGLVILPYLFNPITGIPTFLTIVGILYGGFWVFLYSRNLAWLQD